MTERTENAAEPGIGGDQGCGVRLGDKLGEMAGIAANFIAARSDQTEFCRQDRSRSGAILAIFRVSGRAAGWRERSGLEFLDQGGETRGETGDSGMNRKGKAVFDRSERAAMAARGDGVANCGDDPDEFGDCLHEHR